MTGGLNHFSIEALEELSKLDESATLPAHLAACAECNAELKALRREQQLFAAHVEAHVDDANIEELWSGVSARIAADQIAANQSAANQIVGTQTIARARPQLWRRRLSMLALALPAAAALLVALQPRSTRRGAASVSDSTMLDSNLSSNLIDDDVEPAPDPRVTQALDRAEVDTAHAVEVLEAEAALLRPRMNPAAARGFDRSLQSARERLDAAKAISANETDGAREDVQSRVRMLNGYTRYLRSLQEMVQDIEETRR